MYLMTKTKHVKTKRSRSGSGEQFGQDDEKRQMIITRARTDELNIALHDQKIREVLGTVVNSTTTTMQLD